MLSYADPAVSVAEATAYLSAAGQEWDGTEEAKAAAIIRGQRYVAGVGNGNWAIQFTNETAPNQVKYAIAEAARRELAVPGSLNPDFDPAAAVKRERKKVGPLEKEIEYASPASATGARPVFDAIDRLLAGLLRTGGAAMNFRLVRG